MPLVHTLKKIWSFSRLYSEIADLPLSSNFEKFSGKSTEANKKIKNKTKYLWRSLHGWLRINIPSASGDGMKQLWWRKKNLEQQLCEEYIYIYIYHAVETMVQEKNMEMALELEFGILWCLPMTTTTIDHTKLDLSASSSWTRPRRNATQ